MNKAMLTVGIIILALGALLMINVISNYSTGSELDYYLVKETAEAAMSEAIDTKSWRTNQQIRLDSEKFVENFLVRFANSVDNTRNYVITFYDINEVPPKVSVKVDSKTVLAVDDSKIDFSTTYDGIVESVVDDGNDIGVRGITQAIKSGETGKKIKSEGNQFE